MKTTLVKLSVLAIVIMFTSCIPQKKIEYLQGQNNDVNTYPLENIGDSKIKPGDELLVKVTSFDDINFNFFHAENTTGMVASSELSLSAAAYAVNDSGLIYFPIIGNIYIEGLTISEATTKLEKSLGPYFDQPNVIIKYAYHKIAMIGAVNNPGYVTYTKNRITIFEALSMASDISVHGDIQKVKIIRTENDVAKTYIVDLRQDDIMNSKYYFLQSDDVVYVPPRKSFKWNVISTPIQLTLTSISTSLLILNYVQ